MCSRVFLPHCYCYLYFLVFIITLQSCVNFQSYLSFHSSFRLQKSTSEPSVMTTPSQPEAWSLWPPSMLRSARLNIQVLTHLGWLAQWTLLSSWHDDLLYVDEQSVHSKHGGTNVGHLCEPVLTFSPKHEGGALAVSWGVTRTKQWC